MADSPRIYTCSYQEYTADMGAPVRSSVGTPRWTPIPGLTYVHEIATRRRYLHAEPDVFDREYLAQLDHYGPDAIAARLATVAEQAETEAVVVMCFEKLSTGKPCHRTTFAGWWQRRTGQPVPELGAQPRWRQPPLD